MIDEINFSARGSFDAVPTALFVDAHRRAMELVFNNNTIRAAMVHSRFFNLDGKLIPSDIEGAVAGVIKKTLGGESTMEILCQQMTSGNTEFIGFDRSSKVVLVCAISTSEDPNATVYVWHDSPEKAVACINAIKSILPEVVVPPERDDLVPFTIWRMDARGAVDWTVRDIQCPSTESIAGNYPAWPELDKLLRMERPDNRGRIVIWTGDPGTGKSTALRALSRVWFEQKLASIELVLDPERMFADADYMHQILLAKDHANAARRQSLHRYKARLNLKEQPSSKPVEHRLVAPKILVDPPDKSEHGLPPLRLVLIEDGAEFFSNECRREAGFARLLNMADGIIGQGVRLIFLLTANEKIDRLDPAVIRPGRCIQIADFPLFDQSQAADWCKSRGLSAPEGQSFTLAELYAHSNKWAVSESRASFGFVTPSTTERK